MCSQNRALTLLVLSACLAAGNALAATVAGDLVYKKADGFNSVVHLADHFVIDTAGTYQVTLTDFGFPHAFKISGLTISGATDSLGKLSGPGSFTFEAEPGDYSVSMFARIGHLRTSAQAKGVEQWLERTGRGHYGIEVSLLQATGVLPTPLPAAAWLFASGMLGLAGLGRQSVRRCG